MRLQARETRASWSLVRRCHRTASRLRVVEQRKGLLDDVAELAQALDIWGASAGDYRQDPALSHFTTVGGRSRSPCRRVEPGGVVGPARASGDGRDAIDQSKGLGDVADVGRGRDDFEGSTPAIADQVVLTARLAPVDRHGPVSAPPFSRGRGSRPHRLWTSPARRPCSA